MNYSVNIIDNNLNKKEIIPSLQKLLECTFESKLNFTSFNELCIFESLINKKSFERRLKFLLRNNKDIPNFFLKRSTTHFKKRLKNQIHFKDYSDRELNMNLLKFNKNSLSSNVRNILLPIISDARLKNGIKSTGKAKFSK